MLALLGQQTRPLVGFPPSTKGGSTAWQSSKATGQRGWKRQPGGIATALGVSPCRMMRSPRRRGLGTGTTESSARVLGCWGCASIWRVGPISTIRPKYITAIRSAIWTPLVDIILVGNAVHLEDIFFKIPLLTTINWIKI